MSQKIKWLVSVGLMCLILILLSVFVFSQKHSRQNDVGVIDLLSISTDGRYVISTDEKEFTINRNWVCVFFNTLCNHLLYD